MVNMLVDRFRFHAVSCRLMRALQETLASASLPAMPASTGRKPETSQSKLLRFWNSEDFRRICVHYQMQIVVSIRLCFQRGIVPTGIAPILWRSPLKGRDCDGAAMRNYVSGRSRALAMLKRVSNQSAGPGQLIRNNGGGLTWCPTHPF
jgi:hypothetical protein